MNFHLCDRLGLLRATACRLGIRPRQVGSRTKRRECRDVINEPKGPRIGEPNHFFLAKALVTGVLGASCTDARQEFKTTDPLPIHQVFADVNSQFDRSGGQNGSVANSSEGVESVSSQGSGANAALASGLLAAITADGFCLTAAHVVLQGVSYATVDFGGRNPPFIVGSENVVEGQFVTTIDLSGPGQTYASRGDLKKRDLNIMTDALQLGENNPVEGQPGGRDPVYLVRMEVVKVWEKEDLALVKVPFATSPHFELADEEVQTGEPIMHFCNPGEREGSLNQVSKRAAGAPSFKFLGEYSVSFSNFYPLISPGKFIKRGDSGGAVINRDGKLVGIQLAGGETSGGHPIILSVGIRSDLITETITAFRDRVGE